MNCLNTIADARDYYHSVGFATIPLKPGEKGAYIRDWPIKSPDDMWMNALPDSGIAIRCGGLFRTVLIDVDEDDQPGTYANVKERLSDLGLSAGDYPVVSTYSGVGRHIYLRAETGMVGNCRLLSHEVGSGEIRFGPGSYVVACPTVISSNAYRLIEGGFDNIPSVSPDWILSFSRDPEKPLANSSVDFTKSNKKISRTARILLTHGYDVKYHTRSECEQAIISSLVESGFCFDEILAIMLHYPASGKFTDLYGRNAENGLRWLRLSYKKAVAFVSQFDDHSRKLALSQLEWANSRPWPGLTGVTDYKAYLAHITIALRSGKEVFHASVREVANIANITAGTAANANKRLIQRHHLIEQVAPAKKFGAALYRLLPTVTVTENDTVLVEKGAPTFTMNNVITHDAFASGALGRSSGQIWSILQNGPMTIEQIAEKSGRCKETVVRCLRKMWRIIDMETGELLSIVEKHGEEWYAVEGTDLNQVADILGTLGKNERRQKQHRAESSAYKRRIQELERRGTSN